MSQMTQPAPGQNTLGQNVPGQNVPGQNVPGQNAPNGIVAELLQVTQALSALIEEETTLLNPPRFEELTRVGPQKGNLAARYDAMMRELRKLPREAIRVEAETLGLNEALRRLHASAKANAHGLQLQMSANKRVLDLIAQAATKAARPNFTYGTARLGYGAHADAPPPVAINRVF